MPNHIHAVVVIHADDTGNIADVGDANLRPLHRRDVEEIFTDRTKMLLPKVIHGVKSSVSKIIHREQIETDFQWQRSYYDHIIRKTKEEYERIKNYIISNPLNWVNDGEKFNNFKKLTEKQIKHYYDQLFSL